LPLLQAKDSAFDVGGWDTYGDHWRYFFDCMLAPMASQAQSALEKLPVTATPRASLDTPSNFMSSVMKSWTSMVAEITAGSKEAKGGYNVVPARLFAYALAPQHGPVIRTSLSHLSAEYRKWAQDQVRAGVVQTCRCSVDSLCLCFDSRLDTRDTSALQGPLTRAVQWTVVTE
jgi:flavorubredoxin